jgi:2-oxoisovalerate dehydrogenase E2 component (dihydrolipoyl transacylase)
MPQLGESVTEGTISRWLVNAGDSVSEFDAMVEINTDKVDAEVPAPVTGVLVEILTPEGAVVPIGDHIAVIEVAETGSGTPATPGFSASSTSPKHSTSPGKAFSAVPRPIPPEYARQLLPPALDGDEIIPLSPIRRTIAANMSLSKTTIPHAWQMQEVDMSGVATSLAANRGAVRRERNVSLTYLSYVLAAAADALRKHPELNSTYAGDHIVRHREVNLAIAVAVPEGVTVPVIRNADALSIVELTEAVGVMTVKAREGRLSSADLSGATFTVNNSGALGTLVGYSIIPPGQSGVLTMCAVTDRPVAVDGRAEVRPMMNLCLSLDHRVMDGFGGALFIGECRRWLEGITSSTHL